MKVYLFLHGCRPAYDEFYIVANSYRYACPDHKALYFALVDYEEAPQVFQQMNLNTAPALYHFPAKGTKKRADQMDFQRLGFDAESIAKFVNDRTDIQAESYFFFLSGFVAKLFELRLT